MFRGHRHKVRILFGLSDIALTALAFELAYIVRARMELEGHVFFLNPPVRILLMGWSMLVWVALGFWWAIYDRIDSSDPRVILRDAFRQCLLGAASVRVGLVQEPVRNLMLRNTQLFNLTGHPAISVPAGRTAAGLPCALQLVGARMRTDALASVALACEPLLA